MPYTTPPVAALLLVAVTFPMKRPPVWRLFSVAMAPPCVVALLFVKAPAGNAQKNAPIGPSNATSQQEEHLASRAARAIHEVHFDMVYSVL